jgi:inorganic pyrophosphatase
MLRDGGAPAIRRPPAASGAPGAHNIDASSLAPPAAMSLHNVTPGANAPEEFNVIIEIPMNADPIKYEVDKESGAMFVDRFMSTAMHYPCNYGYVPRTLSDDGDPVDVLVITPFPLAPGVVVTCRPIGVLKMEDEAGGDAKLLAVPIDKILPIYKHWQKPADMNELRLKQIQHFFEHYKDLEPGKWVKVSGWEGPDAARAEVRSGIASYLAAGALRA